MASAEGAAVAGGATVGGIHRAGWRAAMQRTAVLRAPGCFVVEEVARPEPGPRQVRVRLEGCGVCGSNVPVWEGRPWFQYPMAPGAPGHEGWGVVDAVGGEVESVAPGQRVALLSDHAFAEYDVVDADRLAPLPDELRGQPFPAEPLACAMNVFARSGVKPGDTVAVVGVGFLGALLVPLAKHAGAAVLVASRRESALEVGLRQGADRAVSCERTDDVHAAVRELTGGRGCDVVIEATGHQQPLDLASQMVRVRGRLVVAGYHQDGSRQVNMQQWNLNGIDVINAHEREPQIYIDGVRRAVEAVRQGIIDPQPLLTHRYGLSELNEALAATRDRPEGFLKALVMMEG